MTENKLLKEIEDLEAYIQAEEKSIRIASNCINECKKNLKAFRREEWSRIQKTASAEELVRLLHKIYDGSLYDVDTIHIEPDGRYYFKNIDPKRNLRNVSLYELEKDMKKESGYRQFGCAASFENRMVEEALAKSKTSKP